MPELAKLQVDHVSDLRALSKVTAPLHTRITTNARLHSRLDALRGRSVIWVHGLPGAGKTSLIASWLGARGIPPLWYRIDDGDADPAGLFAFLSRAAIVSEPDIETHLPRLSPQQALPAFARLFFQALFSHATASALIFDDYHEIDSGSVVHALLAGGFAEVPQGMTVVVVSRASPPPDFARLRANGQLVVIGPEELRLTAEEAQTIIRDRNAGIPAAAMEAIVARAHGWTAGLVLLLEALETVAGAVAGPISTVPEVVFDYFAGEIFRRMDCTVQDHLLSLAFLPAMTAATATRLTGSTEVVGTLDRLVRRNYFTMRDAQEQPSCRFHPLFRDFLRTTAHEAWSAERLDEVRHRAADVLDDAGQPEAALQLLDEAGDETGLIAMLLRWAPIFEKEGRVQSLSTWLARLPSEAIERHGWLSYWAGMARMGSHPADSRAHYVRARTLFEQAGDEKGLLLSWIAFSESVRLDPFADNAELDASIVELPRILEHMKSRLPPELEAGAAAAMYVGLERRMPEHPEREAWRERALDLLRKHAPASRFAFFGYAVVIYDTLAGRYAQAERLFKQLPPLASFRNYPFVQQLGYFTTIVLQFSKRIPGDAGATARAALDDAISSGTTYWLHFILTAAAIDAQNGYDVIASEQWFAIIKSSVDPRLVPRSAQHHGVLARQELIAGRLDAARRHAETGVAMAVTTGWYSQEAWTRLCLADILICMGELDEADRQVRLAGDIIVRCDLRCTEFSRLLLIAALAFSYNREREGFDRLEWALRHGRQHDVRSTIHVLKSIRLLIDRALAAGIEVEYARTLVRMNRMPCPDPNFEAWPWPLKIATFGGLTVLKDDAPLALGRKTPRRLLELLKAVVTFGGSNVPEAQVIDALWPEDEGDMARQSFTIAVHRLRKLLGDVRFILVTGGRISLNPELCWLDLWSFERLLDGKGSEEPAIRRWERALALYRGDFLAGDDELPWTKPRRDQMRRRYARACSDLAEKQVLDAGSGAALATYRRGIEVAPTAESLYRGLMACHRERNERPEGIAVYRQLEVALAKEAGRRPAPESDALRKALGGD